MISSWGNQATTRFVTRYPGCAIWHLLRKGGDLQLGSDHCGSLACWKHADRPPKGQLPGEQTHRQCFTVISFLPRSPYLLTWNVTVLQLCFFSVVVVVFNLFCGTDGRWRTTFKLNCRHFRPSSDLYQLLFCSEWISDFPPWSDILPLMTTGRLWDLV